MSELNNCQFEDLLDSQRKKDMLLQRTTGGVHRDDLEFTFGKQVFKLEASQGQRKSLLFSLNLAEFYVLKKDKGFSPLLLLDDIFEKLDENRISNLLTKVCMENDGQVFFTDTDAGRLGRHFKETGTDFQSINL